MNADLAIACCMMYRTVGGSSDALGRLTEADLRFLFTG